MEEGDNEMKIICPSCNAGYNVSEEKMPKRKAVATCKKCGGIIEVEPEQSDQPQAEVISDTTAPEPASPTEVHTSPVRSDGPGNETVTDADFEAFMVENSDKYLSKFEKFRSSDTDSFSVTWHWPAFFTGLWWPMYRKLYPWSFIALICSFIPPFGFLWMIAFGMMGNYIYYKHAKKKILELKASNPSPDITALLSMAGGVNKWVITVVTVLIGISLIGIIAAVLIPRFVSQ